jgi:hypothetical protein
MTATISKISLYDSDFLAWAEETVSHLKAGNLDKLDLENLIEEIAALSKTEKIKLKSHLAVLLEHLLKRGYVNIPNDFNGWQNTVAREQEHLRDLLETSPSLKTTWAESYIKAYQTALRLVSKEYSGVFPTESPFPQDIAILLYQDFRQANWQD